MKRRFICFLLICIVLMGTLSACNQSLTVNNPQHLELPGLKWNMTPEEVKEALELTEEQILINQMVELTEDSGEAFDIWSLQVSDLRLYGESVIYASFDFIRYPGNAFGLYQVHIYFDEKTDMVKLEGKLSEIYGLGLDGVYRTYEQYGADGEKYSYTIEANEELKLAANGSQGEAYKDALNDPEYRERLWVATGRDVVPDSVADWIVASFGDGDSAEEIAWQYIDQKPWVRMSQICCLL